MKVADWISKHIYWLFSIVFLVISGFSFFISENIALALFSYVGFFGCLNLHGIAKIENCLEDMFVKGELDEIKYELEELEGE